PLPPPTLFPYTTLFRSDGCRGARSAGARQPRGSARAPEGRLKVPPWRCLRSLTSELHARWFGDGGAVGDFEEFAFGEAQAAREQDRKSTRLNSSHVKIS